jgi:hypothetical protein
VVIDAALASGGARESTWFSLRTLPRATFVGMESGYDRIVVHRRGARVTVAIESAPFRNDAGAKINAAATTRLRRLGADVRLAPNEHLKGAVIDGRAFLDDRNWAVSSADTVVRDDRAADVQAVRDAILGRPGDASPALATRKERALAGERRLLDSALPGEDIVVQTESFGYGKEIYPALARLARAGKHVRLLVAGHDLRQSPRERSAIAHLRRLGVAVRASDNNEKFALCGKRGWIGSANATYARPDQRDWGLRSNAPRIVRHLRRAFEAHWSTAHRIGTTLSS